MNRPHSRRLVSQGMARWLAGVGLAAWCAVGAAGQATGQAGGQAAGQATQNTPGAMAPAAGARPDGQIEMDVVKALDGATELKNDLITAATIQSEVTLSGTVYTEGAKDLAGSIVAKVPGVTKVHNNLTVGDPQAAAAADNLPTADQGDDEVPGEAQGQDQGQGQAQDQAQGPDQGQYQGPGPGQGPYQGQGQDQGPYQGQAQIPPQNGPGPEGQAPPPQYGAQYPQARPQYSPYPAPQYPAQQYPSQPPQYGNPQYGYQQAPPYGYQQQQQPAPRYEPATGPVTVPAGALLQARTNEAVSSKHATPGTPVQFTLIQDVTVGGMLAIPRGATLHGVVTDANQSGKLAGHADLALALTSFDLGGRNYPIQSDQFRVKSPSKAGETVNNAVAGGILGTIVGCIAGRGIGCAVGAGAGAAAGTAASAASPGPNAWIPPEALVVFRLAAPVTVSPVSEQEADRLAQGLYQGGPALQQRRYPPPYGYYSQYGAPMYAPMYAAPPIFFRPYYMMGGVYYWR